MGEFSGAVPENEFSKRIDGALKILGSNVPVKVAMACPLTVGKSLKIASSKSGGNHISTLALLAVALLS